MNLNSDLEANPSLVNNTDNRPRSLSLASMNLRPTWLQERRKQSQDFRSLPKLPVRGRAGFARKPLLLFIVPTFITFLFVFHYFDASFTSSNNGPWTKDVELEDIPPLPLKVLPSPPPLPPYDPARYLRGPPTDSFRENLRADYKYMTGWIGGGYTNDFMTYINMIYLAQITNRIPIVGPFAPTHVGSDNEAGFVPFGDVFDIPRMAAALHLPILEWRDVKKPPEPDSLPETVGGWTVWARYDTIRDHLPRGNHIVGHIGLEVSYTDVHEGAKLSNEAWDAHVNYNQLACLSYTSTYNEVVQNETPYVSEGPNAVRLPPDQHLMIFDFLYFVGMHHAFEWEEEYFQPWRVASHAHWAPRMISLAQGYLMRLFEVNTVDQIPKFISIHVRHADFGNMCQDVPKDICFAPLSVIAVRVKEIQEELSLRPDFQRFDGTPRSLPVVMTSDERDPAWWEEVRELGWLFIDHGPNGEDTVARFGRWYPVFIDAVIQSMGHGFVGTDQSTMSVVAQRRVEDWQKGATRMVRWGRLGADDHEPQFFTSRSYMTYFT